MRNWVRIGNINPPLGMPTRRVRHHWAVSMLYTLRLGRITWGIKADNRCERADVFFICLVFSRACGVVSWAPCGAAGSARDWGIFARSGCGSCLGFWGGFPLALPLDHVTDPSPLARYSPFRRDLDRWDRSRLAASFDDLLCHYGAENSARGIRARRKSWLGGF